MMKDYRITRKTLAIISNKDIFHQSKIVEMEKEIHHSSPPLQIIKENCMHYGAAYDGRKKSVQHHLDFHQKTPIPIVASKAIYTFPTESPQNDNCCWLFFHGVKDIFTETKNNITNTVVLLINGKLLTLDISIYTIKEQYDRTGMCKVVFDQLL
ncbi:competence protein ComK [Gracilibacillus orientalis]|uniref:Competence protein ComK n=1 Tax=Gracilibacillus orientalis TaxID=334253 RepID=A0A1I4GVN0_9BACI|nr:competence protein ComK [Gracilibacillus orientalis]SFL34142.1 competence protein ComK [Gracilibacillus orientalis]